MFAHSVLLLASGQVSGPAADGESQSIYHYCLRSHLRFLREINVNTRMVYVRQADYLDLQDGEVDGSEIRFISKRELRRLTDNGESILVLQVSPVELHRGQRTFQVMDFAVTRRGTEYEAFKGSRSAFVLRLNCETNLFEVELTGQRRVLSF
jgi:hypothetical protein